MKQKFLKEFKKNEMEIQAYDPEINLGNLIYQNKNYNFKAQEIEKSEDKKIIYLSSIFADFLGNSIANNIGLQAMETFLTHYEYEDKERNLILFYEDFKSNLNENESFFCLMDFINNSCYEANRKDEIKQIKILSKVLNNIKNQNIINPNIFSEYFWKIFIFDTYIGNFTRKINSWGVIKKESEVILSPIFNNEFNIYPKTPEQLIKQHLEKINNKTFLQKSVENISSFYMDDEEKRISYSKFFKESQNKDFLLVLKNFYPQIIKSHEKNVELIKSLDGFLTKERINLLIIELNLRLNYIIKPAYERLL